LLSFELVFPRDLWRLAMLAQFAFCPTCGQDSPVDAPPCFDGHDECPDRACAVCGAALVVDPILPRHGASLSRAA
jgi:hypothetical protein